MGSQRLYDYLDDNPFFDFRPTEFVNSPLNIARNHRMVSVNSALQVDITGQVSADSIGYRFYSGIGDRDPADPFAQKIVHFPLHQAHPYHEVSPDRFVLAERLSVLFRLLHASPPNLLVCSVPALMRCSASSRCSRDSEPWCAAMFSSPTRPDR